MAFIPDNDSGSVGRFVPDNDSGSVGRFVPDSGDVPENDGGILDTIKRYGTAVIDDVAGGFDRFKSAKREEAFARSNESTQRLVERQTTSYSPESSQAFAEEDKRRARENSVGASDVANFVADAGINAVRGVGQLGQAITGLHGMALDSIGLRKPFEKIGIDYGEAQKGFDAFDKDAASYLSDSGKKGEEKVAQATGFTETLLTLGADPRHVAQEVIKSLPGMYGAGKVGEAAVGIYGKRFAQEAGAVGLTGAKAEAFIAEKFAANADKITKVAMAGSAAGEGAQQTGSLAGNAQAAGIEFKDYALPAVASGIGDALISFGANKAANKMGIGDIETDIALRKTGVSSGKTGSGFFVNRAAIEGFKEGVMEEMPQSMQETAAENVAFSRPWDQGLGKAAASGLATGFAMGGGHAMASSSRSESSRPDGSGETFSAQSATSASDFLGVPDSDVASAPASGKQTEAEKALFSPKSLTALDRVAEIDASLPMVSQEEALALQTERESITKTWPKAVTGAPSSFSTEAGARVDADYALMESGDLVTSHDENLRPSPLYPPELQPRERERHASEMQVSGIVHKLDPARLGLSADAATGAPVVGADGLVESGNARTIALKRVYQANGQKAADYKQFLKDNAAQFGIAPEVIDGMQKPVLVRVRKTPVNRAEFARQANASTVAQMSPSEQAKADAARMNVLDDLRPDENGDFTTSRDFVRRFMAKLPGTEQAGMMDAGGQLSQTGYSRIRNAILAKAYGDSPVLTRMVESLDDNLRNVGKALVSAAPAVAKVRQSIAEGALHDSDITPDLMAAVEELSRIKDSGQSVSEAISQAGMFGEKYSAETRELLEFLAENMRRPRVMAEFIQRYMEALTAAGNPNQGSIFGDSSAPGKSDLIKLAKGVDHGETGTNTETGKQGGTVAGNQSGRESGAQGDAAKKTEWVAFPPETGSLNIPRSEMPQIKGDHRGALIQFLEGRGIKYETVEEMPADELKPTQAEFSTKKTENWKEVREWVDRSVLISSDDYVLDGHHQWMAALASDAPIKAIKFSAPIRDLLPEVYQFPSVKRSSDSAMSEKRAQAREDFNVALAELGAFFRQINPGVRMMKPEEKAKLMPALVKLFEAGIKEVGYNIKDLIAHVKKAMKARADLKPYWNRIDEATYREAGRQAVDNAINGLSESAAQGDLFSLPQRKAAQQDLFASIGQPIARPEKIEIDGMEYDLDAQNFGLNPWPETLPSDSPLLVDSRKHETGVWNGQEVSRKQMHDEIVRDAFVDAVPPQGRKPIAYVMGGGGASGKGTIRNKLVRSGKIVLDGVVVLDPDEVKGEIPEYELIRMAGDSRGASAVHEESSDLAKRILGKAIDGKYDLVYDVTLGNQEKGEVLLRRMKDAGYEIRLFGVTTDPRAAVVRADSRARGSYRYVPISELLKAHKGFASAFHSYAQIADQFMLFENSDTQLLVAEKADGLLEIRDHATYNKIVERSQLNDRARTLREILPRSDSDAQFDDFGRVAGSQEQDGRDAGRASGSVRAKQVDPAGTRDAGSSVRGSGVGNEVRDSQGEGKSAGRLVKEGSIDGSRKSVAGVGSAQGESASAARGFGKKREAGRVLGGNGGRDLFASGVDDAGAADQGEVGQSRVDGVRGQDSSGRRNEPRDSSGANAGVPAGYDGRGRVSGQSGRRVSSPVGKDIPVKTGRNYSFGDEDLTYAGSWQVKARQNVEAVELLKKLETEGRQATPDEQKTLAKFIGWGASEIANSIFGDKLNKQVEVISQYERAIEAFNGLPQSAVMNSRANGYWPAWQVVQSKNESLRYGQDISREMVEKAKPDMGAKKWAELRDRLKAVMTEQEWKEASRSTQYAHYTSKQVVKAMWATMARMGFKGGTFLEPGSGIGVFPGLMPKSLANNSIYTGIEFDSITGGILKQLFPDERILVESFIDSKLPKNFYDVAVGNPPFNSTAILSDPEYKKQALALHDYFFAKTIDRVKPGGLVTFVSSRYTMDKLNDKARAYLADRADLVGAIRLPQTAFKKNAGTEVVTDVLFLRKKVAGEQFEHARAWAKSVPITVNGKEYNINEYFVAHPEMVLGEHSDAGSMYGDREYTVLPKAGDIEAQFAEATATLPANIYKAERGSSAEAAQVREIDFNPTVQKEGNYYVTDAGVLMQREGGVGVRVQEKLGKNAELVKDFVTVRDALKQAHYDQLNDSDWQQSLAALQKAYAAFVKKHGQINQFTEFKRTEKTIDEETGKVIEDERSYKRYPLLKKIDDDPDYSLVSALETINDETGKISESAFLSKRVLDKPKRQEVRTPADALLSVLNDLGHVDVDSIAERLDIGRQEAIDALGAMIYEDPAAGWVMADEYLSGNVKKKLVAAQEAVKSDKRFERNIDALMAVLPTPVPPADIAASLGMNWIPAETYEQFLHEKTGVRANVVYNERTGQWSVEAISGASSTQAKVDWGTDRRNAADILLAALTGAPIRVTETVKEAGTTKTVFLADATEAANQKLAQMREAFGEWLWQDAARTEKLVALYNDTFNTIVPRSFDGAHLNLPGASAHWQNSAFPHVKRGVWRIVQSGNTYLAHAVGSGKTAQMVMSAMEQKRLGLISKPMMVVPNHMLQQFAREWQEIYPAARLMVADEKNFHTENRRRFVSRVAMSDLDGVVITHSAFKLLDLDPEFKQKMIEQELDYLRAALMEADPERGAKESLGAAFGAKNKGAKSRDPKVKQIESKIEKMEQKLEAAMSGAGKDKNVRFDELGVDFLYVDEAHEFRKLSFTTQRQVKGIDSSGSDRAFDLWMKTRWLEQKTPGRSLVMASGTPVTNTLAELYSVQRFMAPDVLEERGLDEFDAWAAMFGQEHTEIEADASGKYAPVTRFSKFVNVPELTQMFREYADVLTSDHLAVLVGDKRPKVKDGTRKLIITPQTLDYGGFKKELAERLVASRAWKPTRDEPNNPDPVIRIIGDGRLAAIDMRFIDPSLPSDPESKLNRMIDEIVRVHKETGDLEYKDRAGAVEPNKGATQVVFSDLGFGAGVAEHRGFNARAWFEKRLRDAGIPLAHVAFMSDNKKSIAKLKLFKDVNAGRVRVVVGSSKNMGTGVNMQQRLIALHHLDTPWYPADLEQREGRIVRQGNQNPLVQLYAYSTKGSYDAVMWQMLASKQRFIDQALSGDSSVRSIDDLSESSQFQIATAMTADDERAIQLAGLRAEIEKLQRLYRSHEEQRAKMRQEYEWAGRTIELNQKMLPDVQNQADKVQDLSGDNFKGKAGSATFNERKEWGAEILAKFKGLFDSLHMGTVKIGEISGFDVVFHGGKHGEGYISRIAMSFPESIRSLSSNGAILAETPAADPVGVALRAANAVTNVARMPLQIQQQIAEATDKRSALEPRLNSPFQFSEMLADKIKEAQDLESAMLADQQTAEDSEKDRSDDDDGETVPQLSRSASAGGIAMRDLRAVRDRIAARMANMPPVNVLASPEKAPKALRDYIEKAGAWNDVEGAMHEGEIYLFASGLANEERAEFVLATHEITHFGLRGVFGAGLDPVLQQIWMKNGKVRKAAAALRAKNGLSSNVVAVEEVLADMPTEELVKLSGWRKLVAHMRDWFAGHGFEKLAANISRWMTSGLSDQEKADLFVAEVVSQARLWVENGKRQGGFGTDTRLANLPAAFSRSAMKSVSANIDRGLKALAKAIAEKTTVHRAMFRSGLGWVDFEWGDAGKVLPSGRTKGGKGLSHIVEARMRKDELSEKGAIRVLSEMVRTIAAGEEVSRRVFIDSTAVKVRHGGYQAAMVKHAGSNAWIVTAFEIAPGAHPAGYATAMPTQSTASLSRDGLGAGALASGATVPSLDRATRQDSIERGGPAGAESDSNMPRLSRSGNAETAEQRADEIIAKSAASPSPVDAVFRVITKAVMVDRATKALYNKAGALLDRFTPEHIKAGVVADYGIPEAVIDRRVQMQGAMKQQVRGAGVLIDKLATLTRAESRVAYEWMNNADPQALAHFEAQLPPESVKVMAEVKRLIDHLSMEAMRLGQLDPEAFKRNRFEYLRRSYFKHTTELTKGEAEKRGRAISILGDQYKGRGMADAVPMAKFKAVAPEWWGRKLQVGKGDKGLRGEKFIRLERRAPTGDETMQLEQMHGARINTAFTKGRLLEVAYWPAGEQIPARMSTWENAGTWEVRDTKGADLIVWRDFTKQEREAMGEIDEARFAIAKTLHGMIHDVETGKYLEWIAAKYAAKDASDVSGKLVEATDRMRDTYGKDEWVQVPDSKIHGTQVKKYGQLAGRYIPAPIWNDVRQTVGFRFEPFGETYAKILGAWKTSKTALSPAVHTNNVMANLVMADWHDVTAGHVIKALRILLATNGRDGKGVIGRVGNGVAVAGIADREAAKVILNRFEDSGGNIGTWATAELQKEQIQPLLDALEKEIGTVGQTQPAQVGAMVALQKALQLRFPSAWEAFKPTLPGRVLSTEARNMLNLYEAEDQVFRLAAWLRAKEEGATDLEAGKVARKSFLDYNINAPWIQAMRKTAFPFISFTYRAAPMLLDTMANKPWKLLKLGMFAWALNALGYLLSSGDEEDERKYLPEEKAGRVLGVVPKLVRMPWNDSHGSPVFLDIRRFIPVGDILDAGQSHSAIPMVPSLVPGGVLSVLGELVLNRSQFTGRDISLETDTPAEKARKVIAHLYKAFAPNIVVLPGTYAFDGVVNAGKGKTDRFGREQSVAQAAASAFGVKLGSYPSDVLKQNARRMLNAQKMEINQNISQLKRQRKVNGIDQSEFEEKVEVQRIKKRGLIDKFQNAGR